jgi:enolase
MHQPVKVKFRRVLISSGELVTEAEISDGHVCAAEASPMGLTVGSNELLRVLPGDENLPHEIILDVKKAQDQASFDSNYSSNYGSEIGTAMSLAYSRFSCEKNVKSQKNLFRYFSNFANTLVRVPKLMMNILNCGLHADNNISFCEFMVTPDGGSIQEDLAIASQIYEDLGKLILERNGSSICSIGREGGFAPNINDARDALDLLRRSISTRNEGRAGVAIDLAANNYSVSEGNDWSYFVDGRTYNREQMISYLVGLCVEYPEIQYLEDPMNENDMDGWQKLRSNLDRGVYLVADDLTVSNPVSISKYADIIDACVLKPNQIGTITSLRDALQQCTDLNLTTIVSQRSAETSSDLIAHLSVGWGADFLKAGAPARERISKYNELIRISDSRIGGPN